MIHCLDHGTRQVFITKSTNPLILKWCITLKNTNQKIIEIKSVDEYVELQEHVFQLGYAWPNKSKVIRQSTLNPATHVIIDKSKMMIARFFSLEQARNQMEHQRELHRTINVSSFLKDLRINS